MRVLLLLAVAYLAVEGLPGKNKNKNKNKNKAASKQSSDQEVDGVVVTDEELEDALGIYSMDMTNADTVGNAKKAKKPKKMRLKYEKVKKMSNSVLGILREFGYMETVLRQTPEQSEITGMIVNEDVVKNSLIEFQTFNKLPVTGELDDDTVKLMSTPRCGDKDTYYIEDSFEKDEEAMGRVKRYTLSRRKWGRHRLFYHLENYTPDMSKKLVRKEIERALTHWADVADINFIETDDIWAADIKMSFEIGDHGDKYPFYGSGGALAHAFYPTKGVLHFDDGESFTSGVNNGINLYYTATHEIGHLLGIKHSNSPGAVMNAYYPGYSDVYTLTSDDISAAEDALGQGKGTVKPIGGFSDGDNPPIIPPTEGPTEFDGSAPDCHDKIGAALKFGTNIYLFTGKWFYRMVQDSRRMPTLDPTVVQPRLIQDHFTGLPNNLDGAVRGLGNNKGKAYFFKGGDYYLYDFSSKKNKVVKGPLPISQLSGKLDMENIDGAFQTSSSVITYMSGKKTWTTTNERTYTGGEDTIFNKVKGSPDAATRGFIGGWVWIFHGATFSVNKLRNGMPGRGYEGRPITSDWGIPICSPGELIGELNEVDENKCKKELKKMNKKNPPKGFVPSDMCIDYLAKNLKPSKVTLPDL